MRTIMYPVEASTAGTSAVRKGKVDVCVCFDQEKSSTFHAEGCLLLFSNVTL